MEYLTDDEVRRYNRINDAVSAVKDITPKDIQFLKELILLQLLDEDGVNVPGVNHTPEYINKLGDYHVLILRAIEQIKKAAADFDTYHYECAKESKGNIQKS